MQLSIFQLEFWILADRESSLNSVKCKKEFTMKTRKREECVFWF